MKVWMKANYLCQYDNKLHADGSCNMTSLGMALDTYGKKVPGKWARTPDNLLQYCDDHGLDRHSLDVISQVCNHFGLGDRASYTYTMADIKAHLAKGLLVIVQGIFTPSGHVMVPRGFDEEAGVWICNDPAGHYPHYEDPGWESGENVRYPSGWFVPHAAPDGHVWAHMLQPSPR